MSRILGPGSLTIGPEGSPKQFAGDITKVTLTPSTSSEDDTPMLDGSNESGADTTTWELGGTVMDKYTLASLHVWAAENAGTEMPFVLVPTTDAELEVSGTVKIRPFALGGDMKKKTTNDFTFPLVGDPTYTS